MDRNVYLHFLLADAYLIIIQCNLITLNKSKNLLLQISKYVISGGINA